MITTVVERELLALGEASVISDDTLRELLAAKDDLVTVRAECTKLHGLLAERDRVQAEHDKAQTDALAEAHKEILRLYLLIHQLL